MCRTPNTSGVEYSAPLRPLLQAAAREAARREDDARSMRREIAVEIAEVQQPLSTLRLAAATVAAATPWEWEREWERERERE